MRRTFALLPVLMVIGLLLTACDSSKTEMPQPPIPLQPVTAQDLRIVTGQVIYVPAYSEIFFSGAVETLELTTTLAIHNTDLTHPIIIQSVRYYDTDGKLVRSYIDQLVEIPPLATTGFVVEDTDTVGGWGANFIVEWGAEQPVHEPIIEALMVSTRGTFGVSLISPGRVVSQTFPEETSDESAGESE